MKHRPINQDRRVPRARALRRAITDAEKKLWWHLRRLPVQDSHFRRQATIGPYFADFACHERRLVIEVDGGQHSEMSRIVLDDKRSEFLLARGYRVLRFWNNEVLHNIDGVIQTICATLGEPPPLTPPLNAKTRWGRGKERA